jgi:hypothetical protein
LLLVIALLNAAAFLLIGYIGLHLPRSFLFYYLFSGVILVLVNRHGYHHGPLPLRSQTPTTIALILFTTAYVFGMLAWGFWVWPMDALDCINALVLPALLFCAGSKAAQLSQRWSSGLLLSYSIGGLAYGLSALANAREPWWDVSQVFPLAIQVAWPSLAEINVRSVEQTAYPSLLLLAPALLLLARPTMSRQRLLGLLFLVISLLGAHVVWALNGRLGWLALFLALLPLVGLMVSTLHATCSVFRGNRFLIAAFVAAFLTFVLSLLRFGGVTKASGWSQGLCDERFSVFGSMLMRLHQAPWGGRALQIPYTLCGDQGASAFLSYPDGSITVVHNVPLEIYFTVGWLPVVLLMIVFVPNLLLILRGFWSGWSRCDWHFLLRWGWLCFLACQWLFQPLLYSDGLLYYFTFFLLGLFASRAGYGSLLDREAKLSGCSGVV